MGGTPDNGCFQAANTMVRNLILGGTPINVELAWTLHIFTYIFVKIGVGTPDNAPFLAVITMVRHLIRLSIHICLDRGGMADDRLPLVVCTMVCHLIQNGAHVNAR